MMQSTVHGPCLAGRQARSTVNCTKSLVFGLWSLVLISALFSCGAVWADETAFVYDSRGKRDPFVPLLGVNLQPAYALEDIVSAEDIRLQGIAQDASGKKTVIMNGEIIAEGQAIGRIAVIKIEKNNVYILFDDEEHVLTISKD